MAAFFVFNNFRASYFTLGLLSSLFAFFPFPILHCVQPEFTSTLKRAERLFCEKLYGDALPIYSELSQTSSETELKTQLKLRLAACLLEEGQPQKALAELSSLNTSLYRNQILYLLSQAHRRIGMSQEALNSQLLCSKTNSRSDASIFLLDRGSLLCLLGDFAGARLAFQSIPCELSNPLPFHLSQLQLAKVFLAEGRLDEALQTLVQLSFPKDDPLSIERTYLIGWIHQSRGDHSQAAACFESLLPKTTPKTPNRALIFEGAITANLKQTLSDCTLGMDVLAAQFSKIEPLLEQLVSESPNERSFLLLSDFYFIKAKSLEDREAYAKAVSLLDEKKFVYSQESLQQALLKQAAAAPSHQERSQLFEQLCNEKSYPPSLKAKAFFFLGLNDFEEGIACQRRRQRNQGSEALSQEIHLLENAARSFSNSTMPQAALYLALVFAHLPGDENLRKACQTLDQLLRTGSPLSSFEKPEEVYCLYAWASLRLLDAEELRHAKRAMEQISQKDIIDPFWKGQCLKLHALLSLQLSLWKEAEQILASLLSDDVFAPLHGEALFWLAYSKDKQQLYPLKIELLKQAYTSCPLSPYAPAAYFYIYSYREYMQGTRKAIKHLQRLPLLFPEHPLAVSANYLIGLYCKKDHVSEEGKILQRKSWTAAIDAFQEAESTFDALLKKNLIPQTDLAFYTQLRYRSQLERAEANLAIAQISTSGKKQIYLEYAESVFNALIHDFTASDGAAKNSSPLELCHALNCVLDCVKAPGLKDRKRVCIDNTNPFTIFQPRELSRSPTRNLKRDRALKPYPKLLANAQFQLAKTLEEKKEWNKAQAILDDSLERYRQGAQVQSIGLMRTWRAKGKLARLLGSESQALQCFFEAEKAAQGLEALNANEKLDLWIEQALSYKGLNQLELAMSLLSRVVNEDAISPLRIKAMLLRSEIYELQGRPELALKQLEAASRKGGDWAQKAKEKLEKEYGYSFAPASSHR